MSKALIKFDGVKAGKESGKVEAFIDPVLEVMSVANELMLGRMCQVYRKIIGRYGKWFLGHPMYP